MEANDAGDREQVRTNLREVQAELDRIAGYQEYILETGARKAPAERLDLRSIVPEMVDRIRNLIGKDGRIVLSCVVPREPCVIESDRGSLQVVLENLIFNAAQAIEGDGRIEVTVTVEERSDETLVVLQVRDSGRGMDRKTQAKLFTPGFTTKANGHGIGLDVVKKIVAGLKGLISVISDPGQGTLFEVRLPFFALS